MVTTDFNVSIAAGWWLFTATGWLLILDQSLNFHDRLRFLALEQWWTWCFAVLVLLLGIILSRFINRSVAKLNAFVWLQSRHSLSRLRHVVSGIALVAVFVLINRVAHLPSYITGELIKLIFLFLLAGWSLWRLPLAAQLWHEGYALAASRLLTGLGILLLITAVLAGVTADKGTWLVIAICSVILLASVMGWTTGFVLLIVGFLLIFLLGEQMEVVGDRLQAWRNAFTADRDDMSRLLWFQAEAVQRVWGWGVGQTPWCAGERLDQCWGLPLQLQSDYTMTALTGWFGPWGAWVCVIFYSLYVFVWISGTAKRSNSELLPVQLLSHAGVTQALGTQLFFIAGLLVLIQSWITIAGNLSWIPLTGITWPLISYGKTSLWLVSAIIGIWGIRKTYA